MGARAGWEGMAQAGIPWGSIPVSRVRELSMGQECARLCVCTVREERLADQKV